MQDENDKYGNFFANLRYLVNQTGLKDYEIAMRLGIHKVTFAKYFSLGRLPTQKVLNKIADYFGVDAYELLHGDLLPARSTIGDDIIAEEQDEYGHYPPQNKKDDYLRETFAARLTKAMQQQRINQVMLSATTGIAQSAISKYVNGRGWPKLDDAYKIAQALKMSIDWLVGNGKDNAIQSEHNEELTTLRIKIGIVTEMLRGALKQIETN